MIAPLMPEALLLLAQLMIWLGAASLMMLVALDDADHSVTFFTIKKAFRTIYPVHLEEANPDLIQVLDNIDPGEKR